VASVSCRRKETGMTRALWMDRVLMPDATAIPLTPQLQFVAGVNSMGRCGVHRQKVIANLRPGEPAYLVRECNNPHDANAVMVVRENGQDIGFLAREPAVEIAARLDAGSPVTATVVGTKTLTSRGGQAVLGVDLSIVPHRMKRKG
jgi:hypothetical protein